MEVASVVGFMEYLLLFNIQVEMAIHVQKRSYHQDDNRESSCNDMLGSETDDSRFERFVVA